MVKKAERPAISFRIEKDNQLLVSLFYRAVQLLSLSKLRLKLQTSKTRQ